MAMGESTAPVTMMTFGVAMMFKFVVLIVQSLDFWVVY
jgi:hypothetical protein